jgi:hypothetical protein
MTTETITTETIKPSEQASRTFIRAKQAKTEAGKAYDEARQTVIDAFAYDGVEVVFVDDHKIECVEVTNRDFDIDKLESLIPASVLRQVVKMTVDKEAFDKAVKDGLIPASVEQEVVTPKHTVRVDSKKGVAPSVEALVGK